MKISDIGTSIESLSGVGKVTASQFARLNIFTVADLLETFPRDYEDRSVVVPLSEFRNHSKINVVCKVLNHSFFGYGKMKTLKITITDGRTTGNLICFNRSFLEKTCPVGSIVYVNGRFSESYNEIQSSVFEVETLCEKGELTDFQNKTLPNARLLPLYSLTEGLSQKMYRKTVNNALKLYASSISDELPSDLIEKRNLLHKNQAIYSIHNPESVPHLNNARYSLIYEELYNFEYKMALRCVAHRNALPVEKQEVVDFKHSINESLFYNSLSPKQKQLFSSLPFKLTDDQIFVIHQMNFEIDKGQNGLNQLQQEKIIQNPQTMNRLLQGDVGSGKTLTGLFIALRIIDWGAQVAFMAPTELLALQHAENTSKLLEKLNVNVAFLTGNVKSNERQNLLNALKDGTINIVVGTHALFSQNVNYKNLGLVIIDEQHRFGVVQRESIINKGRVSKNNFTYSPNVLMMSATPIPQTLALTAFGDLDISVIKTKPEGRKEIKTFLTVQGNENNVYSAVHKELENGHQAYFVYPCIDEDLDDEFNEKAENVENSGINSRGIKNAEGMFKFLQKQVFPNYKCALIHSKVDPEQKKVILEEFKKGSIDILVATTVVEVGVDVPNATCMVIENADRFALNELHQLRGRVGRSDLQSYCFLVYSKNITEIGKQRLKALHDTTDGFVIAEQDLKLRGPGEVFGTLQSGYLALKIADLARDKEILFLARSDAFDCVKKQYNLN